MAFDLKALQRQFKPEQRLKALTARPAAANLDAARAAGTRQLLIDTNVYIHEANGRLPDAAAALLDGALRFHSSVCISEIALGLSYLSPKSRRFRLAWDFYAELFMRIPDNRIHGPTQDTLAAAAMIAGSLARTQGYSRQDRFELYRDAAIYLTATKLGLPVLTANRRDFDLLQQAAGMGHFIHYVALP